MADGATLEQESPRGRRRIGFGFDSRDGALAGAGVH